jgi:hypothetical protein
MDSVSSVRANSTFNINTNTSRIISEELKKNLDSTDDINISK